MTVDTQTTHTIDATGRGIGRVATEAATILMGKHKPTFERHKITGDAVHITNASKLKIDPRKLETKMYKRYSGFPGGLKEESLGRVIERKGIAEVLNHAIRGMLPANRLRKQIMKNITISE